MGPRWWLRGAAGRPPPGPDSEVRAESGKPRHCPSPGCCGPVAVPASSESGRGPCAASVWRGAGLRRGVGGGARAQSCWVSSGREAAVPTRARGAHVAHLQPRSPAPGALRVPSPAQRPPRAFARRALPAARNSPGVLGWKMLPGVRTALGADPARGGGLPLPSLCPRWPFTLAATAGPGLEPRRPGLPPAGPPLAPAEGPALALRGC